MLKSLMLMSAVAIAAPALAQTSAPASTTPAQPAATSASTAAQPATAATPSTSAQQPTTAATPEAGATSAPAAAATPSNSSDAVTAVISADWAKYDTDNDGSLSKTEFGAWMTALREKNPAQKAAVKDPAAWTTAAFAMADKDKNGTVNKAELAGFLKG